MKMKKEENVEGKATCQKAGMDNLELFFFLLWHFLKGGKKASGETFRLGHVFLPPVCLVFFSQFSNS
jgi:hypothetical protein